MRNTTTPPASNKGLLALVVQFALTAMLNLTGLGIPYDGLSTIFHRPIHPTTLQTDPPLCCIRCRPSASSFLESYFLSRKILALFFFVSLLRLYWPPSPPATWPNSFEYKFGLLHDPPRFLETAKPTSISVAPYCEVYSPLPTEVMLKFVFVG